MAPQRTTTLDFIDSKSHPPQWPPRQPRTAPCRGLEAAQLPRLASANAQPPPWPSLPTHFSYISPSSASLPSLSESAPRSQKSQNSSLRPALKATPQLPAGPCVAQPLVSIAQSSQAPRELAPGGQGSELCCTQRSTRCVASARHASILPTRYAASVSATAHSTRRRPWQ